MVDGRNALRKMGAIAATTAAITVALPLASAYADSKAVWVYQTALATKGSGYVWFHDGTVSDTSKWSLTLRDVKKDRWCAEMKIIIDRPGKDTQIRSNRACGKGHKGGTLQRFKGSHSNAFVRGVKVQLCRVEEVAYSNEKCVTKQYVKNPYYHY
ncbi:hypothetical protein GCM10029978_088470 [Actinoallomurus acanthiterrae]